MSALNRFRRPSSLYQQNRGSVAIEFALVVPLLATLLVGVLELSNYMLFNHKASNASFNALNLLNKLDAICKRDMDVIERTLPELMGEFDIGPSDYSFYVTYLVARPNVTSTGTEVETMWQFPTFDGRGFGLEPSNFTYDRANPMLNVSATNILNGFNAYQSGFTFENDDHLTIIEMAFRYKPFFNTALSRSMFDFLSSDVVSYKTIARPRKRNLQGLPWEGKCA